MKKLLLINLFVCAMVSIAFISILNQKPACSMNSSSCKKMIKPKVNHVIGGAEADDPVFHFNRVYIKI